MRRNILKLAQEGEQLLKQYPRRRLKIDELEELRAEGDHDLLLSVFYAGAAIGAGIERAEK